MAELLGVERSIKTAQMLAEHANANPSFAVTFGRLTDSLHNQEGRFVEGPDGRCR